MIVSLVMAGMISLAPSALLDRYCVTCHTQKAKERGTVPVALDNVDLFRPPANAELWEKVVRKLRAGAMPPPGSPRSDQTLICDFVASLETALDHAVDAVSNPGHPLVHRLNRAEYANAIRDLFSVEIDAAALLPPDDSAFGFDNMSEVLGFSPLLQE